MVKFFTASVASATSFRFHIRLSDLKTLSALLLPFLSSIWLSFWQFNNLSFPKQVPLREKAVVWITFTQSRVRYKQVDVATGGIPLSMYTKVTFYCLNKVELRIQLFDLR